MVLLYSLPRTSPTVVATHHRRRLNALERRTSKTGMGNQIAAPKSGFRFARAGLTLIAWRMRNLGIRRIVALVTISIAFMLVAATHQISAFTHPAFYAEDGQDWFADAYNTGWLSLPWPVGGYLVTYQRLWGLALAPLGLHGAALGFAVVATLTTALPPILFLSARFRSVVSSDWARGAIGLVYLAIPNPEIGGNLTNSQWALAILAFLIVVAPPPVTALGAVLDIGVLAIACLSGPYAWLFLPLAVVWGWRQRSRSWWARTAVLVATAGTQALIFVSNSALRSEAHRPFGASPIELPFIIANQFIYRFSGHAFTMSALPGSLAVSLLIGIILFWGFTHGPRTLRLLVVFALLVSASGLIQPYEHHPLGVDPWPYMATGQGFSRYFFYLSIAVALCTVQLAYDLSTRLGASRSAAHSVTACGLAAICLASVLQWQYPALPSEHLARYQTELTHVSYGTPVTIPIEPQGWTMTLIAGR
jgi:hypothetical protein